MRCTSCYLLVAALLLAALLFGNPLPRRAVVHASGSVPTVAAAPAPACPDPALAAAVVRHEVRSGNSIWWLQDGGAVVVRDGRAQRIPAGVDPLGLVASGAVPAAAAAATAAQAAPAPAVHAAAAGEPGHDPR